MKRFLGYELKTGELVNKLTNNSLSFYRLYFPSNQIWDFQN